MKPLISLTKVGVTFERFGIATPALQDLTLAIEEGEFVLLGGPNGSGKSTLLRLISGAVPPSQGEAKVVKVGKLRESVPFHIQQDPTNGTAGDLTVYENLYIADQSDELSRSARKERYSRLLQAVGLEARLNQLCRTLSGGERQLISFLIAGLRQAAIILLDEPTASLDPGRASLCVAMMDRLAGEGRTLVMVSHSIDQLSHLGDRTVLLRNGSVVYDRKGAQRPESQIRDALSLDLTSGS